MNILGGNFSAAVSFKGLLKKEIHLYFGEVFTFPYGSIFDPTKIRKYTSG